MSQMLNAQFTTAERQYQVSELFLQGWSQAAIAEQVQASQATVSGDIQAIQDQWRTSGVRNFDLIRERELQKLELMEREAWAAWRRSYKPTVPAEATDPGRGTRSRKTAPDPVGDPRFLEIVNKCLVQRRGLLGLDAPLKVADVTPLLMESVEERQARLRKIFQVPQLCVSNEEVSPDQATPSDASNASRDLDGAESL